MKYEEHIKKENLINEGCSRAAYRLPDGKVLKIYHKAGKEILDSRPENAREIAVWQYVKDTPLEQYFLPILEWGYDDYNVEWLVMPFSQNARWEELEHLRPEVPSPWGDKAYFNMGWYKGYPVIRDYGALTVAMVKRANWSKY